MPRLGHSITLFRIAGKDSPSTDSPVDGRRLIYPPNTKYRRSLYMPLTLTFRLIIIQPPPTDSRKKEENMNSHVVFSLQVLASAGLALCLSTPVKAGDISVTEISREDGVGLQLWFNTTGPGLPGFGIEHATILSPDGDWARVAVPMGELAAQSYWAGPLPMFGDRSFYRVVEAEALGSWMESAEVNADEGSGSIDLVIHFNCHFRGTISYTIGGTEPGLITDPEGSIWVDGTTASLSIDTTENEDIDTLRQFWINLDALPGMALLSPASSTVTVKDNDAVWYGVFQSDAGSLGFEISMIDDGSTVQGHFGGGEYGFFPSGPYSAPVTLSETQFSTTFSGIILPAESNLLGVPATLTLALAADEALVGGGPQRVEDQLIEGSAVLTTNYTGMDHLDTIFEGQFTLQRAPALPANSEPDLVAIP
jgi:hypothetical protein